jgi:hypothetical protein
MNERLRDKGNFVPIISNLPVNGEHQNFVIKAKAGFLGGEQTL